MDLDRNENVNPDEKPEEFPFLQETIKKEPLNKKRMLKKLSKIAVCGILFGLSSCIGFFALKPWAERTFLGNPTKVEIPEDYDKKEEPEAPKESEEKEAIPMPEFNEESFAKMNASLYEIARKNMKGIVVIQGIREKDDWMNASYDTKNSVSGVIVADNGVEFLILANNSVLKGAKNLTVTFHDDNSYAVELKKEDQNLGIAIFSIAKATISSSTLNLVEPVALGNSNFLRKGQTVIAVGQPFGYAGGYGYGVVSSLEETITVHDGVYHLLLTDIPGKENGSGVLLNPKGEVVGLIQPNVTSSESITVTNALAISDIKKNIELLSNGEAVPYLGILGTEVTEEIQEEHGIPRGIYVKKVATDSPAMKAGIQSGDVITEIGDMQVTSFKSYQEFVLHHREGDELVIHGQRKGKDGYVKIRFDLVVGRKE